VKVCPGSCGDPNGVKCFVVASDCIKTYQRSEETSGSRRRQEQRTKAQLSGFKDVFDEDAHGTILQQSSKRDSREDKTVKTATCTFVLTGELRFAADGGCTTQVFNTHAAPSRLQTQFEAYAQVQKL